MAIGNMHRKFGDDHTGGSGDILADKSDRQTDAYTDTLITILHHHSRGLSNNITTQQQQPV